MSSLETSVFDKRILIHLSTQTNSYLHVSSVGESERDIRFQQLVP